MIPRPVLMPGGWPLSDGECDGCARVLLACGGDLRRVFDEPEKDLDAYARRLARVPFFSFVDENPLFLITGRLQKAAELLDLQSRVFEATGNFHHADWVTFQSADTCLDFLDDAAEWAMVEEAHSDIYFWFTWPRPTLVVTSATNVSLLPSALAALVPSLESGVLDAGAAHRSNSSLGASSTDERRPGPVIGLESLARMRAVQQPSADCEHADTSSQHFKSVRPNPRIRRGIR